MQHQRTKIRTTLENKVLDNIREQRPGQHQIIKSQTTLENKYSGQHKRIKANTTLENKNSENTTEQRLEKYQRKKNRKTPVNKDLDYIIDQRLSNIVHTSLTACCKTQVWQKEQNMRKNSTTGLYMNQYVPRHNYASICVVFPK